MSPGKNRFSATRQTGFTIVEIVVTLIIVGILAVTAVPRFFDRKAFDARAFSDQTQAMLRYAQKIAIAQNRLVSVRLNGASVALCFDRPADCANAVANQVPRPVALTGTPPAACANTANSLAWFCEPVPAGITYPATGTFYFNELGRPYNAADVPGTPTTFNAKLVLNISNAANATVYAVTIERETGYVHLP